MLSRLCPQAGPGSLLKSIVQLQLPASSAATSAVHQSQSGQSGSGSPPRPVRYETNPETRLGFIPKSWFDFMYPKTGVTGPYMLMAGLSTYLFSKEIIVVSPEFAMGFSSVMAMCLMHYFLREKAGAFAEKKQEEEISNLDEQQDLTKRNIKERIEYYKEIISQTEGVIKNLPEAKRENVYLQLEAAYRERLNDTFTKVKKHLDYQIEKQSVERRLAQKNMVDYIIRNVEASISSQLKTQALKQSLSDLKKLTVRS